MKGLVRSRFRLCVLILGALGMAACSSTPNPDDQQGNSAAPTTPTASAVGVFAPHSGQVIYTSTEAPEYYAVSCAEDTELRLAEGFTVDESRATDTASYALPEYVGSTFALPAGSQGYRVPLNGPDGHSPVVMLRCLPAGFPVITVEGSFSSWLSLTTWSIGPHAPGFNIVLDSSGFPVWFRQAPATLADFQVSAEDMLIYTRGPQETRVRSFTRDPDTGFSRVPLDGSPSTSWLPSAGLGLDHHAAVVLPNGNMLGIRYEDSALPLSGVSGVIQPLLGSGSDCPASPATQDSITVRGRVVEVSPSGEVVRAWRMEDHLPGFATSVQWVSVSSSDGGSHCVVDVDHLNSLQFLQDPEASPGEGTLLVTGRHIDGAFMLSWPSGEVLWTLGGGQSEHALRILEDPLSGLRHPHDANMLSPTEMLVYDNRYLNEPSRAVVYKIDLQASTATLIDSYSTYCHSALCYAEVMGSSRRIEANGNILVGWGSASVAASEFARGESSPSAELLLKDTWAYRVLPAASGDHAEFFTLQDRELPR